MNNRREHHTRAYLSLIEDSKASNVLPSNHRGCLRLEGLGMFFRETIEGAQGKKVKNANEAILVAILKKHDDENIMRVHIYLRWRIAGLGMFSRETIEGAQGYKVNNINEAILEAILKKHGGLEATCVFSDAALRTSLLYVVYELLY
ncbi:hypothetical protein Tco_0827361 [Tanacetum coccineum]